MVKLIDAVFLWSETYPNVQSSNLAIEERRVLGATVKIIGMQSRENEEYFELPNSTGRCFGGWETSTPLQMATHALAVFNWMLRHGVDFKEAHEAFMEIEEYADWVHKETGPFREAYYAYHG